MNPEAGKVSLLEALIGDPNDELELIDTSQGPPPDKGMLVWFLCLLLGIGLLLPWNAYITAADYYALLWPTQQFEFFLSICYNYPSIVFLLWNIKWGHKYPFGRRIFIGFTGLSFCILLVPIITTVFGLTLSHSESITSEVITLLAVFLSGCFASMLFGTVLGLVAFFPSEYTAAVMSGNGVAGILVGLIRIFTKLAFSDTEEGLRNSSVLYFVIGAIIVGVCAFAFLFLTKNPFATYYLAMNVKATRSRQKSSDYELIDHDTEQKPNIQYWSVFKKLWPEALEVFWVFFVTLTVFPGYILEIPSQWPAFQDWFSILLIFDFQLFDFVGRTVPKWMILFSRKTLFIPVILRTLLVGLFVMCIPPTRIITIDGFPYLFMALFAFTNGYCGTLAMMYGPTRVDDNEKETAGAIMGFMLNLGIFIAVQVAVVFIFV